MGSGITTKFALFMVSVTQTLDPKVTNRPQLDNDKTRPPHAMRRDALLQRLHHESHGSAYSQALREP